MGSPTVYQKMDDQSILDDDPYFFIGIDILVGMLIYTHYGNGFPFWDGRTIPSM